MTEFDHKKAAGSLNAGGPRLPTAQEIVGILVSEKAAKQAGWGAQQIGGIRGGPAPAYLALAFNYENQLFVGTRLKHRLGTQSEKSADPSKCSWVCTEFETD